MVLEMKEIQAMLLLEMKVFQATLPVILHALIQIMKIMRMLLATKNI